MSPEGILMISTHRSDAEPKIKHSEIEDTETKDVESDETKTTEAKAKETKTIYEAWKVVQYFQPPSITRYLILGLLPLVVMQGTRSPVLTLTPQNFYSQEELKGMYTEARTEHDQHAAPGHRWSRSKISSYETKLEERVTSLDRRLQRQLELLVNTRVEANSTKVHRREYKIVQLREVPGGESLTGYVLPHAGAQPLKPRKTWYRPWRSEKPQKIDYYVLFEGTEVKKSKTMWAWHEEKRKSELWARLRNGSSNAPE